MESITSEGSEGGMRGTGREGIGTACSKTETARLGGVGDHPERGEDERDGTMELALEILEGGLEILEAGLEIERGSKSEIFPLTFLYFPSLPFTRPNEERGGGALISEIFLWRSLEEEQVILRVETLE